MTCLPFFLQIAENLLNRDRVLLSILSRMPVIRHRSHERRSSRIGHTDLPPIIHLETSCKSHRRRRKPSVCGIDNTATRQHSYKNVPTGLKRLSHTCRPDFRDFVTPWPSSSKSTRIDAARESFANPTRNQSATTMGLDVCRELGEVGLENSGVYFIRVNVLAQSS